MADQEASGDERDVEAPSGAGARPGGPTPESPPPDATARRRPRHAASRSDASGERADTEQEPLSSALPPRMERWRRRSATGAIMTGFAFGLREVFEPERREPSITLETSGVPPSDLPVDAEFDGFTARRTVVRIRPWLLERTGGTDSPAPGPSGSSEPAGSVGGPTPPAQAGADPTDGPADGTGGTGGAASGAGDEGRRRGRGRGRH